MATEEISCKTKVETKIRLNLKDLDKHYNGDGKLKFHSGGSLKRKAHSYLIGKPHVIDHPNRGKYILFKSYGVKNLECEFDLEVLLSDSSKIKIVKICNPTPVETGVFQTGVCITRLNKESQIQTITGIMTLTFEVEDGVALKDELIYRFGDSLISQGRPETMDKELVTETEQPKDIKIECQGETIVFHKSLLSKISDVFQNMVDNPNFIESQNGVITMNDVSPNTIKAFHNLLYHSKIEDTDLDVQLMIFCDKYNIKPMVNLCSQLLQKKITKENLMEIVDAAYKINDDTLLKKAMEFVGLNYGSFDEIEEWKDFIKSNPKCVAKMMEFIMFK